MAYPEAETIHLVLDNLNIHRPKALADAFGAEMSAEVRERFTIHYTPTHGSWLNQAEIEIGSSRGNVWDIDVFLTLRLCVKKRKPGTVG